jgi:hypothetical protein
MGRAPSTDPIQVGAADCWLWSPCLCHLPTHRALLLPELCEALRALVESLICVNTNAP